MSTFSASWAHARAKFINAAAEAKADKVISVPLGELKAPGGEQLVIDFAVFGDMSMQPSEVLIHSAGTHGVEGFAGSAIQVQFLQDGHLAKFAAEHRARGLRCVFVHVVNPYGMAWHRRWNENNVDLNRNFMTKENAHASVPPNDSFDDFKDFLYPGSKGTSSLGCCDCFGMQSCCYIAQHGMESLKQTVAGGQYKYQNNLFYGGSRLEEGAAIIVKTLAELGVSRANAALRSVLHIDVHTGLGPYAWDTLLADPKSQDAAEAVYGREHLERKADGKKSVFYKTHGALFNLWDEVVDENVYKLGLVQEFGTLTPVKVLEALRAENVMWQGLGERAAFSRAEKRNLLAAFYPTDAVWRLKIATRGCDVLLQALAHLGALAAKRVKEEGERPRSDEKSEEKPPTLLRTGSRLLEPHEVAMWKERVATVIRQKSMGSEGKGDAKAESRPEGQPEVTADAKTESKRDALAAAALPAVAAAAPAAASPAGMGSPSSPAAAVFSSPSQSDAPLIGGGSSDSSAHADDEDAQVSFHEDGGGITFHDD